MSTSDTIGDPLGPTITVVPAQSIAGVPQQGDSFKSIPVISATTAEEEPEYAQIDTSSSVPSSFVQSVFPSSTKVDSALGATAVSSGDVQMVTEEIPSLTKVKKTLGTKVKKMANNAKSGDNGDRAVGKQKKVFKEIQSAIAKNLKSQPSIGAIVKEAVGAAFKNLEAKFGADKIGRINNSEMSVSNQQNSALGGGEDIQAQPSTYGSLILFRHRPELSSGKQQRQK